MSFNFESYLSENPPPVKYSIQPLDGGVVNQTVRAKARSLILKHAPPFVAAVGPTFPFSPERQTVEATALRLFHVDGPLHSLRTSPPEGPVVTAEVVGRDTERSILMIEDLGPLGTLWDLLSDESCALAEEMDFLDDSYWELGNRIGAFFAGLHSGDTVKKITTDDAVAQTLSHSLTHGLVHDAAVVPLLERMKKYGIANAEKLQARVSEAYKAPAILERFALGDCHPGAFLVQGWRELPFSLEGDGARTVAVIDWEFSHVKGQGVDGDIAQLLASLYCHLTASNVDGPRWTGTYSFMQGLSNGYGKAAEFNRKEAVESDGGQRTRLQLLRSSMILYGREIINQVFEREAAWAANEATLTEMVAEGALYIDLAGGDTDEMLKNFERMRDHDFFLVNLFGWGKQEPEGWEYTPPVPV